MGYHRTERGGQTGSEGGVIPEESPIYQARVAAGYPEWWLEGWREGFMAGARAAARRILGIVGTVAFGPPDAQTAALIDQIDDLARLEELALRTRKVRSWQELLRQPLARRRAGRRKSPSHRS
jgi:hypothetical protein